MLPEPPYVIMHRKMQDELREMYLKNGTNLPLPGDVEGWRDWRKREDALRAQLVGIYGIPSLVLEIANETNGNMKKEPVIRLLQDDIRELHHLLRGIGRETAHQNRVPEKVVAARIVPEGTNVLAVPRIGDAARNEILENLQYAFADGVIDQPELDARQAAALSAKTRAELNLLVEDLPVKKKAAPPERKKEFLTGNSLMVFAVAIMSVGMILSASILSLSTAQGASVFVAAWAAGIVLMVLGWNTRR